VNKNERTVADALCEHGWTVLAKGWPDFLCVNWTESELLSLIGQGDDPPPNKEMRILCLELKRNGHSVTREQRMVHAILNAAGIPCRVIQDGDLSCATDEGRRLKAPVTRDEIKQQASALWTVINSMRREMDRLLEQADGLCDRIDRSRDVRVVPGGEIPYDEADEVDPTGTEGA